MKFHVKVVVNGKEYTYFVDNVDNELDAQHHVYADLMSSIQFSDVVPWTMDEEYSLRTVDGQTYDLRKVEDE